MGDFCYTYSMPTQTESLFQKAVDLGASDIHIAVGSPVQFRIDGNLVPQSKSDVTSDDAEKLVRSVLKDGEYERFQKEKELDASFQLAGGERLRINCCYERGNVTLVARIVPPTIPTLEQVGLSELGEQFLNFPDGLILFTGPTGSGKSTSLAALLHQLNQTRPVNVITVEDPIEFVFPKGKGIVRQRQYGEDFTSFPEALKHILRQDPDVVMVGEMRDPETIAAALTLAETGHLTFATLHTPNAVQTIDRIIDVFPPHQQAQVRAQLSMSLRAVVAQRLLPKEGGGRVSQREVLLNTPAVANIIRDNRMQEMKSVLQTGSDIGMISFDKDLKRLLKEGKISQETNDAYEGI